MHQRKQALILFAFLVFAAGSCKKWDAHIQVGQQDLKLNLAEKIARLPQLSTLSRCLKETSLDKLLSSSKAYTIWAPDNEAMKKVPASVLNDTVKLKALLMNLISQGTYFKGSAGDSIRVPMLDGKRLFFSGTHLDSAAVEMADVYVR